MNQLMTQGQKLLEKAHIKSEQRLFTFDPDLNAWVRIENHTQEHEGNTEEELFVTDKDQTNLWFAW